MQIEFLDSQSLGMPSFCIPNPLEKKKGLKAHPRAWVSLRRMLVVGGALSSHYGTLETRGRLAGPWLELSGVQNGSLIGLRVLFFL